MLPSPLFGRISSSVLAIPRILSMFPAFKCFAWFNHFMAAYNKMSKRSTIHASLDSATSCFGGLLPSFLTSSTPVVSLLMNCSQLQLPASFFWCASLVQTRHNILGGLIALIGLAVLILTLVVSVAGHDSFQVQNHLVSELGAQKNPWRLIFHGGLVTCGFLLQPLVLSLWRLLRYHPVTAFVGWLSCIFMLLCGLFPLSSFLLLHWVFATLLILCFASFALLLSFAFRTIGGFVHHALSIFGIGVGGGGLLFIATAPIWGFFETRVRGADLSTLPLNSLVGIVTWSEKLLCVKPIVSGFALLEWGILVVGSVYICAIALYALAAKGFFLQNKHDSNVSCTSSEETKTVPH